MVTPQDQPVVIDHRIRTWGLVIGSVCLVSVALANNSATSLGDCFGMCGCVASNPPTYISPHHFVVTCPTWGQLLPVLRFIDALPVETAILLVGSVIVAVQGLLLERLACRALRGQPGPGWVDVSYRRVVYLANIAQLLQLLPLIVVIVIGFVALLTFSPA